jgi:predicted Zn-dependent peptidase
LEVLSVILGGNSSSRLYENIREKAGMAYYIYTYGEDFHDVGYFAVQSGVGNDKCAKALAMVIEDIQRMKYEEISEMEISRAKSFIKGRMAISLESSSNLANFVASQDLLTGKILTPREKFDKINAVTAKDVQRVARKIFVLEKTNLALIGPYKDKIKLQKIINTLK